MILASGVLPPLARLGARTSSEQLELAFLVACDPELAELAEQDPTLARLAVQSVESLLLLSGARATIPFAQLLTSPRTPTLVPVPLAPLARLVINCARNGKIGQRAVARLATALLSRALGVLAAVSARQDEDASDPEPTSDALTTALERPPPAVGTPSWAFDSEERQRVVAAALLLLDGMAAEELTAFLQAEPQPALELLRAVLPAAVGLSSSIVGEVEQVEAAAERLGMCLTVVELLVPAATALTALPTAGHPS
jgi:hypothetical protein